MSFLFPFPPSFFVIAMSALSFGGMLNGGISEVRGKNINYSKFWSQATASKSGTKQLPSRVGMLVCYLPALVVALASFAVFNAAACPRCLLLSLVLSIHFLKRVFEVLLIHQYSGQMGVNTVREITFSYLISTITMIYAQHLTQGTPDPTTDLRSPGVALFLIGITGNFYHHYLLSRLRRRDDKGYKIPKGGLFGLVICPHYLFEIVGFMGVAFISQTMYVFSFTFGSMFYLMGRSYSTRKWYESKFQNFPSEVKALIPYVF